MWDKKDRRRIRLQKIGIEPTINEQLVLEFWFEGNIPISQRLPRQFAYFNKFFFSAPQFPFLNFVTHLERRR